MRHIRSARELAALARDRQVNGILRRYPVRLELPQLAQRELIRWQRRFDLYQKRCGCVAGSFALLGTLGAGTTWLILIAATLTPGQLTGRIAMLVVMSIGAAGVAKFGTLLLTQMQFTQSCHRLANLLRE